MIYQLFSLKYADWLRCIYLIAEFIISKKMTFKQIFNNVKDYHAIGK